jgi:hypothetical protein
MRNRFCLIALGAAAASILAAQTGAVAGPQAGYLVEPVSLAGVYKISASFVANHSC